MWARVICGYRNLSGVGRGQAGVGADRHRISNSYGRRLPSGITVGPDGALFFTENAGNKIGRITTAGVITEFPIPTENSQPNGITTGPTVHCGLRKRAPAQVSVGLAA
jgi:hypothetical protein